MVPILRDYNYVVAQILEAAKFCHCHNKKVFPKLVLVYCMTICRISFPVTIHYVISLIHGENLRVKIFANRNNWRNW